MTTEAAELGLADVLAAHEIRWNARTWSPAAGCACDRWTAGGHEPRVADSHAAHVAEEVRTWLWAALTSPEVVEAAARASAGLSTTQWLAMAYKDGLRSRARRTLAAAAETLGAK